MKNKDIEHQNDKGQFHGYQEWYGILNNNKLWRRFNAKNGQPIKYEENHYIKRTNYYII